MSAAPPPLRSSLLRFGQAGSKRSEREMPLLPGRRTLLITCYQARHCRFLWRKSYCLLTTLKYCSLFSNYIILSLTLSFLSRQEVKKISAKLDR